MAAIRLSYPGPQELVAVLSVVACALSVPACTQHAVIEEIRVAPNLVCPCDPVRTEVIYQHCRRIDVTLDPPGVARPILTAVTDTLTAVTVNFPEVCEPAIVTAVGLLADPETEPATAALNVPVLLGSESIPARSAPICGAGCTITGYTPIRFSADRFSETIDVLELCNRSGRRVVATSPEGIVGELPFAGCSAEFAGASLVGNWTFAAQPRITPLLREVCPDESCTLGPTGPRPGVEAGAGLELEFIVGCPAD